MKLDHCITESVTPERLAGLRATGAACGDGPTARGGTGGVETAGPAGFAAWAAGDAAGAAGLGASVAFAAGFGTSVAPAPGFDSEDAGSVGCDGLRSTRVRASTPMPATLSPPRRRSRRRLVW